MTSYRTEVAVIRASLTRPANTDVYAAGDHVSDSTSAATADFLTFPLPRQTARFAVRKLRATKSDGADVANASFRLHLLSALPDDQIADNAALSTLVLASKNYYLGAIDFTFANSLGGFNVVEAAPTGGVIPLIPASNGDVENNIRNCYGVLEARGAYTPGSAEVFTFALQGDAEIEEE